MKLQFFTYMFRPITEVQGDLFGEDSLKATDYHESLKNKQAILEDMLETEDFKFSDGQKEYEHQLLISQDKITVYQVANQKHKTIETHFVKRKEEHFPSCLVIFDNRDDIQRIAIEVNSAFKPTQLGEIIANSLNESLKDYLLMVDVRPSYRQDEFWEICHKFENLGGIQYVRFTFPYPNLPRVSDMVGEYFTEWGEETNSEPTLELKGQGKEGVRLEEENEKVQSAVKACANAGTPINIKPMKGRLRTVGKKSNVIEEIENCDTDRLKEGDLFSTDFNKIVEILNWVKMTQDDYDN